MNNQTPGDSYRISVRASRIIAWMQTPFHRYAARLLARPRAGAANTLARAELGLGAKTHWVMQVANLGATVAVVGLGAYVSGLLWGTAWETLSNPAAILFLGFFCWAPLINWRMALQHTTREQALMLLLPGMPQGVALNRALARRQLIQIFAAWLLMTLAVLCIPWDDSVRPLAQALCVLTLPLLPQVVQDWSRLAPMTFGPVATMVLKGLVWMPGLLLALYYLQVPVPWIALVSAVVGAATLVWRWKRLDGFAQAFPAGHRA